MAAGLFGAIGSGADPEAVAEERKTALNQFLRLVVRDATLCGSRATKRFLRSAARGAPPGAAEEEVVAAAAAVATPDRPRVIIARSKRFKTHAEVMRDLKVRARHALTALPLVFIYPCVRGTRCLPPATAAQFSPSPLVSLRRPPAAACPPAW